MAELELVQERKISGRGVLKLPDDAKKIRYLILYADVIRKPRSLYLNYNYNPPRSRYATLVFLRNEYVINEVPLEFDRQSFDGVNDVAGQTMIAVKCAYEGILISFQRLGLALNVPVVNYTDLIKDYENLALSWDEIRVKCYADTAVQLRLFKKDYDSCDPDKDKQDRPPAPPPPLPPIPQGEPITDLSEPYDDITNDNGNTEPYIEDEFPPPEPEFPDCAVVIITVRFNLPSFGEQIRTHRAFAPVGDVRVTPSSNFGYEAFCKGLAGGTCQPTQAYYALNSTSEPLSNFVVVSIVAE